MTAKKKPDTLGRDVQEAERLGYGCHYGDYIAARDNQTPDFLKREAQAPAQHPKVNKMDNPNGPVIITQSGHRACQICGKPLGFGAKKYCKGECQDIAYKRYHSRKHV